MISVFRVLVQIYSINLCIDIATLNTMVFTCCVPECNTGYRSSQAVEKVAVFRFPKSDKLRQKWIKTIPCKNWLPGDSHRVCAKHLNSDDFKITSSDTRMSKRTSRDSQILRRQRLKPNTVPRIFPNLPVYLSSTPTTSRATSCSSSSARLELENAKIQSLIKAIL